MATWLCKTEPGDYSYDDLIKDKKTVWDGVKNPQACANIRKVVKGDDILIYHTGKDKAIMGLAKAVSNPYEDPKNPGTTAAGDVKFPVFDIKPVAAVETPMTLAQFKADAKYDTFDLVRLARLSVMAVPKTIDNAIRKNCGLPK